MAIMISIPDDCKPLADAVTQLVASVERAHHRADGGRAVAQVIGLVGERTAARLAEHRLEAADTGDETVVAVAQPRQRVACRVDHRRAPATVRSECATSRRTRVGRVLLCRPAEQRLSL